MKYCKVRPHNTQLAAILIAQTCETLTIFIHEAAIMCVKDTCLGIFVYMHTTVKVVIQAIVGSYPQEVYVLVHMHLHKAQAGKAAA